MGGLDNPTILALVSNQASVSPQGTSVLGIGHGLFLIWNSEKIKKELGYVLWIWKFVSNIIRVQE